MPLYFGDFLNYFIVADILNNIRIQCDSDGPFKNDINKKNLDSFSIDIAKQDCWFGYLNNCKSFSDVFNKINNRIKSYRQFHSNRLHTLEGDIQESKTNPGEPISRTAELLKNNNIVPQDTNFFIRIDQLEVLLKGDVVNKNLGQKYRQIINKILGDRDARVSYKIGTRRYDWDKELKIYGTDNKLENLRDYRVIDIDNVLRRKEDTKAWVFPQFADDVFKRRFVHAKMIKPQSDEKKLLKNVFGSLNSTKKIHNYVSKNKTQKKLYWVKDDWPKIWKDYLSDLATHDPLESLLASAWLRQRGQKREYDRHTKPPPEIKPWNKTWWRKERIQQAQMQIASRSSQRMLWAGKDDVIGISSGNISIFLSICYEIWELFLRFESKKDNRRINPLSPKNHIDIKIQSMGIHNASHVWYEKISEQPDGDDRQKFISFIGKQFKIWLSSDKAMSYPGHNGFSVSKELFEDTPYAKELKKFLDEAVDYGDLYDAPHTTKKSDRKERIKWYLAPILSPYFQIPHQHTKEPYYLENLIELYKWIVEKGGGCMSLKDKKRFFEKNKKQELEAPSLFDYIPGKKNE